MYTPNNPIPVSNDQKQSHSKIYSLALTRQLLQDISVSRETAFKRRD